MSAFQNTTYVAHRSQQGYANIQAARPTGEFSSTHTAAANITSSSTAGCEPSVLQQLFAQRAQLCLQAAKRQDSQQGAGSGHVISLRGWQQLLLLGPGRVRHRGTHQQLGNRKTGHLARPATGTWVLGPTSWSRSGFVHGKSDVCRPTLKMCAPMPAQCTCRAYASVCGLVP